jgi:Zn-dependent M28 family amino/carboxypeptidase
LLGAHFDTRPAADRDPTPYHRAKWIAGANDGASGVAVLLELARVLNPNYLPYNVQLAFFDAEDRGQLAGWPFSVGARYAARRLTVPPAAVVIVDMVGDANQTLYLERTSTPALAAEIWAVANSLGYRAHFIPQPKYAIIDDHLPFAERGLPAANLIDFDYPAWHTTADTVDKVSAASLERVGRTLEAWLQQPN